ncbi:MAG TPA: septum formation initiator family protein [Holophagaceae bacterium]|nr:septum formation initiator family protein [Holophagaceae bacterium]HJW31800.1 septum formation initiator family protein [Holophagaceae bacterium]
MNVNWLLRSRTVWWCLGLSALASLAVLWLSPDGIPELGKRQRELAETKRSLLELSRANRELYAEVHRLAQRDPELMEALARRQGFAKPGETVYTFKDRPKP